MPSKIPLKGGNIALVIPQKFQSHRLIWLTSILLGQDYILIEVHNSLTLEVALIKLSEFQPHLCGIISNLKLAKKTKYEIEVPTSQA